MHKMPLITPSPENKRTLGIFGYVDDGKTTLTTVLEGIAEGRDKIGSIKSGTTTTDFDPVEKLRGITIHAASTWFDYNGHRIFIMDTPGHYSFANEVNSALMAVDGALLLVDGKEGPKDHTIHLAQLLLRCSIPFLTILNKMDKPGSFNQYEESLSRLEREVGIPFIPVQYPVFHGLEFAGTKGLWDSRNGQDAGFAQFRSAVYSRLEQITGQSFGRYNSSEGSASVKGAILEATGSNLISPVFLASGQKMIGCHEILDGIVDFLHNSMGPEFAVVIKRLLNSDRYLVRVNGSPVRKGSVYSVFNGESYGKIRVQKLGLPKGERAVNVNQAESGDIAVIDAVGAEMAPGDCIGGRNDCYNPGRVANVPAYFGHIVSYAPEDELKVQKARAAVEKANSSAKIEFLPGFGDKKHFVLRSPGELAGEVILSAISRVFGVGILEYEKAGVYYASLGDHYAGDDFNIALSSSRKKIVAKFSYGSQQDFNAVRISSEIDLELERILRGGWFKRFPIKELNIHLEKIKVAYGERPTKKELLQIAGMAANYVLYEAGVMSLFEPSFEVPYEYHLKEGLERVIAQKEKLRTLLRKNSGHLETNQYSDPTFDSIPASSLGEVSRFIIQRGYPDVPFVENAHIVEHYRVKHEFARRLIEDEIKAGRAKWGI